MDHDIQVWHDKAGRIIAWGQAPQGGDTLIKVTPLVKRGRGAIMVRLAEKELAALHETHRVDPKSRKLVRKKTG